MSVHQWLGCTRAQTKSRAQGSIDKPEQVYKVAMDLAGKAVQSDVLFIHPPSHVALACVLAGASSLDVGEEWRKCVCNARAREGWGRL